MSVAVTGATGRTGKLVVQRLLKDGKLVHAFVRNAEKAAQDLPAQGVRAFSGNLADAAPEKNPAALRGALDAAFAGCKALVICSSAMPVVTFAPGAERPTATFAEGLWPETVDFHGQVAQIEAARAAGVEHVVIISSMGMSDPNHMLNKMGPDGNILKWKKKAEDHLRASGLKYTVIRPGGLLDEPAGQKQLLVGNDDIAGAGRPSVPRADVAEMAVRSLRAAGAANRTFDLFTGTGPATASEADFDALFSAIAKFSEAKHAPA
eukprot:tig00020911_g15711.t1